jgi:hypothetical protein
VCAARTSVYVEPNCVCEIVQEIARACLPTLARASEVRTRRPLHSLEYAALFVEGKHCVGANVEVAPSGLSRPLEKFVDHREKFHHS